MSAVGLESIAWRANFQRFARIAAAPGVNTMKMMLMIRNRWMIRMVEAASMRMKQVDIQKGNEFD